MKQFYNSLKILSVVSALALSSCSSDNDSNNFTCPTVESTGEVTVNQNSVDHKFTDFKYSYLENEGKNADGNYVFEMVYATYDINSAKFDDVDNGARLIFKFTSPTAIPSGTYSMTDATNKITSASFIYRDASVYLPSITIDEMNITFSGMTDCYAHSATMSLKDNSITPAITVNGNFTGGAVRSTITPNNL